MFLQDEPIGPGDRVMAGLSVAFDASLRGDVAGLAVRRLPRPGPAVAGRAAAWTSGPWLVANDITVVSTVPTLVALWPAEALDDVRLLILGGEACPPELGARLATADREVWNTYGPTEATVVACGARLDRRAAGAHRAAARRLGPRRRRRATGQPGARRRAGRADHRRRRAGPLPRPGQGRREVRPDADPRLGARLPQRRPGACTTATGLLFVGRADDQVKLGGRRIELGEIDSALLALPGVSGAAAAVRRSDAGNQLLVGYVAVDARLRRRRGDAERLRADAAGRAGPAARRRRRRCRPAPPGKVDRDALPWPLPARPGTAPATPASSTGTAAWIAGSCGATSSGADVRDAGDDFFDLGGGSLTAAQLVSRLRDALPRGHRRRRLRAPDARRPGRAARRHGGTGRPRRTAASGRCRSKTQVGQVARRRCGSASIGALRWLTWVGVGPVLVGRGCSTSTWLPDVVWWWVLLGWLAARRPRRPDGAGAPLGARSLLRGVEPGRLPARRHGAPAAVARRAARRRARRHQPRRRRRGCRRTRGCSAPRSAATSTCTRPAGHRAAHPGQRLLGRARGRPRRPLARRRRRCTSARSRVGAGARVGARSTLLPRRRRRRRRRGRARARRSSATSRTASPGRAPRPRVAGAARGPWATSGRRNRPAWVAAYAASAVVLVAAAGPRRRSPALARRGCPAARRRRLADGAGHGAAVAAARDPRSAVVVLALLVLARRAAARRSGSRPGTTRCTAGGPGRRGRPCGCSTRRAPGSSRSTPSALTPAWLRALGRRDRARRRGLDGAADPGARPPSATGPSSPTTPSRRLRARRRLAADRAGQDRQARVRRQLRDGRARAQGAQAGAWSPCSRPRRGAGKAKAGTSWLGSPPRPLRRDRGDGDDSSHLRPADAGCGWPGRSSSSAGSSPVMARASRSSCVVVAALRWPCATAARGGPSLLGGPVLLVAGAVAAGVTTAAKWLLVGRIRAVGAPAVELVRLAQRAGRHLRRGGRGAVVRPRCDRHAGAQPVAARAGRPDRARRLVRDLLAARGRPRSTCGDGVDRQPRLRGADPPVPRPGAEHGPCDPRATARPWARTA